MPRLSKKSIAELSRVVKATTGRDLSVSEGYVALHYLLRLTHLLWEVRQPRTWPDTGRQLSLFEESSHSGDTIAHAGI
jgi:hypothetical protein